jgi:hypothetical protein
MWIFIWSQGESACDESSLHRCVDAGVKRMLIVYEFLGREI